MAGVFINYRTADNPYGPAAIHDGLVRRFGEANVFRDCVSVEAGTIYPDAIRTALVDADIVVAVLGPTWQTAVDESTGTRLIDRPHDWVRRELSWAFGRGTPVLPVLLRDTPANAEMPHPDDLPADIRQLAKIQAFHFSQRTFGPDLDRLITTLRRMAPTLPPDPPHPDGRNGSVAPPDSEFFEIVNALHDIPCMRDDRSRSLVVGRLPDELSFAIQDWPEPRAHIAEILGKCIDYDGGVPGLLSAIRDMNGGDSLAWRHLIETVRRRLPGLTS